MLVRCMCHGTRSSRERHRGDGHKEDEDGSKNSSIIMGLTFFVAKGQNNDVDIEQRGDSPVLVMHDGVTKSIFAHLIPPKRNGFPGMRKCCENDCQRFGQLGVPQSRVSV